MSNSDNNGSSLNIANHELLIRVDSDVKHLTNSVNEIRERQQIYEKNSMELSQNLTKLTYNVGAIVEGMKDAKESMKIISEHATKITNLEERCFEQDSQLKSLSENVGHLKEVNVKGKFLWKIVWGIITTPIALAIIYWITSKLLQGPSV